MMCVCVCVCVRRWDSPTRTHCSHHSQEHRWQVLSSQQEEELQKAVVCYEITLHNNKTRYTYHTTTLYLGGLQSFVLFEFEVHVCFVSNTNKLAQPTIKIITIKHRKCGVPLVNNLRSATLRTGMALLSNVLWWFSLLFSPKHTHTHTHSHTHTHTAPQRVPLS